MWPWMNLQGWMNMMALPNTCSPSRAVAANPMQQMMESWQKMWLPQAVSPAMDTAWPSPKITVMTIELGDMRAYIEPAMAMLNMMQGMAPQKNWPAFWPYTGQAGRA